MPKNDERYITVLKTFKLESYLKCVVGAEMLQGWPDETFWHPEAHRAQAYAARAYAWYMMNNPRTSHYMILGDARDQACDCTRRRPESDRAVDETKDQIVVTDSRLFIARYINKCGLKLCPRCKGKGGYRKQRWVGRMCQYGAEEMARANATALDILQRYYGTHARIMTIEKHEKELQNNV